MYFPKCSVQYLCSYKPFPHWCTVKVTIIQIALELQLLQFAMNTEHQNVVEQYTSQKHQFNSCVVTGDLLIRAVKSK